MSQASTNLDDRCTRLLKARVREFFRHLPLALAGEEESIHQMRVAGRRARVVLPLLARKPEGNRVQRARRSLKTLVRTAAACRDLDVCLALFDQQAGGQAAPSLEVVLLRRRLRAARTRSRTRMTEALLDQQLAGLRRDLRTILARAGEELPTVFLRIQQTRDLAGQDLRSALEALGDRFDPDELHGLRRRARRLRYAAEAAGEIGGAPADAAKHLKRLQEHLGGIHDAYVLAAWLGRQAAAAEGRNQPALAAEGRKLEAAFLELSRVHHRTYLEHDPAGTLTTALALIGPAEPVMSSSGPCGS